MPHFAYIDVRPFLFLGGLPLFIGLALLLCRVVLKVRLRKRLVVVYSALIFSALFVFFLTAAGPFVGRKKMREHMMNWQIQKVSLSGMKESEIILTFIDFPGYFIGNYSNELAEHLRLKAEQPVKVLFEVTLDYGKVRGFHEIEIAGLEVGMGVCRFKWIFN